MSEFDLRVLLATSIAWGPMLLLLVAPLVRPSLVPVGMLNARGNAFFVDLGAARATFLFMALFFVGKTLLSVRVDAAELGAAVTFAAVLALVAGAYAHIIWRRAVRPHP